jgi:hypothetical protein
MLRELREERERRWVRDRCAHEEDFPLQERPRLTVLRGVAFQATPQAHALRARTLISDFLPSQRKRRKSCS